ncbi:MAG TPA: hypothetical protein VGP72_18470 [Planctomycetota bacterium]|jgi:hypothetical protein
MRTLVSLGLACALIVAGSMPASWCMGCRNGEHSSVADAMSGTCPCCQKKHGKSGQPSEKLTRNCTGCVSVPLFVVGPSPAKDLHTFAAASAPQVLFVLTASLPNAGMFCKEVARGSNGPPAVASQPRARLLQLTC